MRSSYFLGCAAISIAAASAASVACSNEPTVDGFSQAEWNQIKTLSPIPDQPAPDTTNKYADNPMAAALGQKFFMDKSFGGPIITGSDSPGQASSGANGKIGEEGKVGCVSCHQPANFMMDRRSTPNDTSIGTQWMIRNAATSLNASFYKIWCEKDGVRDTQWSDALTDPEDPTSMDSSRNRLAHIIYLKYKADYNAIFQPALDPDLDLSSPNASRFPMNASPVNTNDPTWGDAWNAMKPADQQIVMTIYANFGKAIQAYLRLMGSRNAAFDKYVAGDYSAIDASSKNGLHLFIGKAGCVGCHSGPIFSDSKFHNTGFAAKGDHINPDETGRYAAIPAVLACEFNSNSPFSDDQSSHRLDGVTVDPASMMGDPSTIGQWRTTQLRNVGQTAPYMHTGQLAQLKDVVHFYNQVGTPDQAKPCAVSPPPAMPAMHDPCYYGTIDKLMKPLSLSDSEETDLANFLNTLTGDPLPANLAMDTSSPGGIVDDAGSSTEGGPDATTDGGAGDAGGG